MEKFETKIPPNMIEFRHTSLANEWVMRITADRRIEVNEGVEVNDAAKKVLEAMQHMLTLQRPSRSDMTWVGLTVEDKMAFLAQDFGGNRLDAMDWAEERLKEKNT